MATAMFPGVTRPVLVPQKSSAPPSLSQGRDLSGVGDLTIHRITGDHHGRTLLLLGHAAEHLAHNGRYSIKRVDQAANAEAIHILMGLSREVFEEFAERRTLSARVQDWLVERAVRLFN
jgi:hypothetical protein